VESQIDECVECCVRDRDFSKKKVFRCEYCGRLLCEKHIEPRLSFIPNFNPTGYSHEIEALYYKEHNRRGGHPDFGYSRKKFEDLDIEEKTRNELIKQALDRMNAHYEGSTMPSEEPSYTSIPIEGTSYPLDESPTIKVEKLYIHKPKSYSKPKLSISFDWKTKKLLRSLKFWLPLFWIVVGFLYFLEGNNPTTFYNSVPEAAKYVFYIFAAGVSGWIGYKIFNRVDSNTTSDRGLFGLKLLAFAFILIGVFLLMLMFGVFYPVGIFTNPFGYPTLSLSRIVASVFFSVLGLALILISAYLVFKFERRSGVIVYRR
jgi:hypothetical protein